MSCIFIYAGGANNKRDALRLCKQRKLGVPALREREDPVYLVT